MSSTGYTVGVDEGGKTSSRVLKPPGGGHSNIFGSSETKSNPPRPGYNQQNSSNMSAVMGTKDPNENINQFTGGPTVDAPSGGGGDGVTASNGPARAAAASDKAATALAGRERVPPGGHSQGFW